MKKKTKGERFNWKLLNETEKLYLKSVNGKLVSKEELKQRNSNKSDFIVE